MATVKDLEPKEVWKHFDTLLSIPHESKNEAKLRDYIINVASEQHHDVVTDDAGNVLVTLKASPGRDTEPIIILQAHIDMVCVKAKDKTHNFDTDPIPVRIEDDKVIGDGTTLGADNGVGVAFMLALMTEPSIEHGPLELLFTVDEEAGMTGVHNLKGDFLKGRKLINLDTEEWGEFYISCAGGGDVEISLPINFRELSESDTVFQIEVSGLKGGHSGCDINEGRGNANKILSRILWRLNRDRTIDIIKMEGGSKRNVIASTANALFCLENGTIEQLQRFVDAELAEIRNEIGKDEPQLRVSLTTVERSPAQRKLVHLSTEKALNLLQALPHGVLAMSRAIPGLVETSANLGLMSTDDECLKAAILVRSAFTSKVEATRDDIEALATLAGASVQRPRGYPGWKPNPDSPLLSFLADKFSSLFGEKPEIKAIHAGLECGIISEKYPDMDMVSIGPDIRGAHTVGEYVTISSVKHFWEFLKAILAESQPA